MALGFPDRFVWLGTGLGVENRYKDDYDTVNGLNNGCCELDGMIKELGLSDKDLMDIFCVNRSTVYRWKKSPFRIPLGSRKLLILMCRIPRKHRAPIMSQLKDHILSKYMESPLY